jgi:hypothetical protein
MCMTIFVALSLSLLISSCCSGVRCVAWAANTLGLEAPVEVAEADFYWDGGSLYVLFHDAEGTSYPVCQDFNMSNMFGTVGEVLAAAYPSERGRDSVLEGREREAVAILLRNWLRYGVPKAIQDTLRARSHVGYQDDPILYKAHIAKRFVEKMEEVDRFQESDM